MSGLAQSQKILASLLPELVELRKALHNIPELAGQERATSDLIAAQLTTLKPGILLRNLGGHGVLAVFSGRASGPYVVFRAELDALPIPEVSDLPYKSRNRGVSHKCGHDGHMATLIGLAKVVSRITITSGRIGFLFQPAEEVGEGALKLLNDTAFECKPDYFLAWHNIPGEETGTIVSKPGTFACASTGLLVQLTGTTSHAAFPEEGNSPYLAMLEVTNDLVTVSQRHEFSDGFSLVTLVHSRLGQAAFGVSPGDAEIMFTFRAESDDLLARLCNHAENKLKAVEAQFELAIRWSWVDSFPAIENDQECFGKIQQAAIDADLRFEEMCLPFRWSDDFGNLRVRAPILMFGIGSGKTCTPLHNPSYDFCDELLAPAISTLLHFLNGLNMLTETRQSL